MTSDENLSFCWRKLRKKTGFVKLQYDLHRTTLF
jgi:hypothetical protein